MDSQPKRSSLVHFTKHLFLVSKVYSERQKAREEVYAQLEKMKKSIIRMNLSYTDVDRLKSKIDKLISWEGKYAKFFKSEDNESQELKSRINSLEIELSNEKGQKQRIMGENEERLKELTDSLESVKHKLRNLMLERAKRHHRLKKLEEKISQKVDSREYYNS